MKNVESCARLWENTCDVVEFRSDTDIPFQRAVSCDTISNVKHVKIETVLIVVVSLSIHRVLCKHCNLLCETEWKRVERPHAHTQTKSPKKQFRFLATLCCYLSRKKLKVRRHSFAGCSYQAAEFHDLFTFVISIHSLTANSPGSLHTPTDDVKTQRERKWAKSSDIG